MSTTLPRLPHSAVLLCGGSGRRMQGVVVDKVLAPLQGKTVFDFSVAAFLQATAVSKLVIVYRDQEQRDRLQARLSGHALDGMALGWTTGGAERSDSVHRGLEALGDADGLVFIHDCARPLITPALLQSLAGVAEREGAAVAASRVTDTIKRAPGANPDGAIHLADLDRTLLWAMQTPQVFQLRAIREAYRHVVSNGLKITDDVAAAELAGIPVALVENPSPNPKVTRPEDIDWLQWLLSKP